MSVCLEQSIVIPLQYSSFVLPLTRRLSASDSSDGTLLALGQNLFSVGCATASAFMIPLSNIF